jgi:hypothetical protein
MGTPIDMYRIRSNVKLGYWVLEHGNVPLKDTPVFLRETIMRLAAVNSGKLEEIESSIRTCQSTGAMADIF